MLVLSRKQNEQIVIGLGGQTIVVRVVEISRSKVRLGITAPDDVPVHREQVWKRLDEWHTRRADHPTEMTDASAHA